MDISTKDTTNPPTKFYATRKKLELMFQAILGSVSDINIRNFLEYFIEGLADKFYTAPGSRDDVHGHHTFQGGLAYHTLTCARLAGQIVDHYTFIGADVDKDIVIAGIVLHDIGKILCYEWTPMYTINKGGAVHEVAGKYQHTEVSKLHHHIPIGYNMFLRAVEKFNDEGLAKGLCLSEDITNHLAHIILAHHGRKSWSSPVIPYTIEAYIVHAIEMMDAYVDKYSRDIDVRNIYDH